MTTAPRRDIEELAAAFNATNPFVAEPQRELALTIYRALAEGRRVPIETIARVARADYDWVIETLEGWTGVHRDEEGSVVGFWGLALTPTDHAFELDGTTLYTWCAWDPLFIAPLLGRSANVASTCPTSGRKVTFQVGPEGVDCVDPPEAVLSFLRPTAEMKDDVVNSFCHHVRLFESREAADEWITAHPRTFVLSLEDGFELGRVTLGRLGGRRDQGSERGCASACCAELSE